MKKFGLTCFVLLFGVLLTLGVFFQGVGTCPAPLASSAESEVSNRAVAEGDEGGETVLRVDNNFFDYVSISQDGYVNGQSQGYSFVRNDFTTVGGKTVLYSSKTVTISCLQDFGDSPYSSNLFSVSVGGNYVIENNVATPDSPYLRQVAGKNYIVFSAASDEQKSLDIYVRVRVTNVVDPIEATFTLIQTNISLLSHHVQWSYAVEHGTQTVDAPTDGCTYPPITLTIPNGTELNPVFVKFVFCGETFEVYNVDGEFYNAADDRKLDFTTLIFDVSGTYSVEIYDKTHQTGYAGSNYRISHFVIVNQTSPLDSFYFNAHTTTGQIIMNDQFCNNDVVVELQNINNIRDYVQQIVVSRQYRSSSGRDVNDQVSYGIDQIEDGQITFNEDGVYQIAITLHINGITQQKNFQFTLLKDIRTQLTVDSVDYKTDLVNRAVTIPITRQISTSYASRTCPVSSLSSYSFTVTVANSSPSISGVNNNARSNDDVTITVHGVGNIVVTTTENGKTTTKTYKDGDRLPTFTASGKYFIKITDQMGSTLTKSFSINIKLNAAALILIILAVVVAVLIVVFIIISRMKVKVR